MLVEKVFNKLDEKVSSLLKSMGIIITLLFGFIALLYNYFSSNLIFSFIVLVLLGIFTSNLVFILYIYIFKSTKKDEFLHKLNLNIQLNQYCRLFYPRLADSLPSFFKYDKILGESRIIFKTAINEIFKRGFSSYLIIKDDGEYYDFKFNNIKEYRKIVKIIENTFHRISFFPMEINQKKKLIDFPEDFAKKFLNDNLECIGILDEYNEELSKYIDLEIPPSRQFLKNLEKYNPYIILEQLILEFSEITANNYEKLNEEHIIIRKKYEHDVNLSYSIFGIGIVVSCIILFIIIIIQFIPLLKIN